MNISTAASLAICFRHMRTAAFASIVSLVAIGNANAEFFFAGDDYKVLPGEARVQHDGRVEVNEFFWYGCPACFRFEPALINWIENDKPDSINFVPIPATLNSSWEFHARVHFAFELLGMHRELSEKFFDQIHVQDNNIVTPQALEAWASVLEGVDTGMLMASLGSFATNTKLNQASLLAKRYQIQGVPTLIVGEKYQTSPALAGSSERALEIVEFLAEKILRENVSN